MGVRVYIAEHDVSAVVETSIDDVIDQDKQNMSKIVRFSAIGFYKLEEHAKLLEELSDALPTA